jgi:hypothetical protein
MRFVACWPIYLFKNDGLNMKRVDAGTASTPRAPLNETISPAAPAKRSSLRLSGWLITIPNWRVAACSS